MTTVKVGLDDPAGWSGLDDLAERSGLDDLAERSGLDDLAERSGLDGHSRAQTAADPCQDRSLSGPEPVRTGARPDRSLSGPQPGIDSP